MITIVKPNLNDNVFLIRFKSLYELYKQAFINEGEINEKLLIELVDLLKISHKFIYANLMYLKTYGYVDNVEGTGGFVLTYRGIQLIEVVTDGNMKFSDDNITENSNQIIRLFQEGVVRYGSQ